MESTGVIESMLRSFGDWFVKHGFQIILIWVGATIARKFGMVLISRLVHRSIDSSDRIERKRDRKLRADTIIGLFDSFFKIAIWTVIIILVAVELGLSKYVQPLLSSAVAISLLLGFGLQTFVKDLVSGIFIVSENQYRVGDVVSLATVVGGDVEGLVTHITLRTTILRDNDGAIHTIPNGNISRSANLTLDYAKVNIELSLPQDCNFTELEDGINKLGIAMHKEAKWHRKLIQAPFYHGVYSLEEDKAIVQVRAKTLPTAQWDVSSELRRKLAELLSQNKNFAKKKPGKKS